VSDEVEKSGESQRNSMAVNVECFEARLDVVENRVDRFGECIDTIQTELVPKLKESVLEELLAEINLKETRKQNSEMLNRDVQNSPQGIENIRANKIHGGRKRQQIRPGSINFLSLVRGITKLSDRIELVIPKNRMFFVFRYCYILAGK
jgi:hypothetical protein